MNKSIIKIGSVYAHTKTGRLYRVLMIGHKVKSATKVVIYEQLCESFCGKFPKGSVWVRDHNSFTEKIIHNGKENSKFEFIKCLDNLDTKP